MDQNRRRSNRPAIAGIASVAIVVAIAAAAVATGRLPGAGAASSASIAAAASRTAPATPGASATARVQLRWFVFAGKQSLLMLDAIRSFAAEFNAANRDGIDVVVEAVTDAGYNDTAYDILKTEIAAGNAPDIIGPIGLRDRNGFEGLLLDLTSRIARDHVDLGVYDSGALKLLQVGGEQVGLPFTVDPSFIFYNKALFKAAGLPDLPTAVGDQYMGQVWDWNELGRVAARLTLDSSGRNSTQPAFDPDNITQFGFDFSGGDFRQIGSTFGSGTFVEPDGKTAQIPPVWADAVDWYYSAMWTGHIAPTGKYQGGAFLGKDPIASGHLAKAVSQASSIAVDTAPGGIPPNSWGMAVMPSWKGKTTAPLGVETFSITTGSRHPDEAFALMRAIEDDYGLPAADGWMPGVVSAQSGWYTGNHLSAGAVLTQMERYAAYPGPDENMPSFTQSVNDCAAFMTRLRSTPGLNMPKELDALLMTLQRDWTSNPPLM